MSNTYFVIKIIPDRIHSKVGETPKHKSGISLHPNKNLQIDKDRARYLIKDSNK